MVGRISLLLTFACLFTLLCGNAASAQVRVIRNGASDDQTPKAQSFSVPKEPQAIVDALDEFDRYSAKEAWEKAFASLATVSEATQTGLIPAQDGFYLPTHLRVRHALATLSPAGRAAYRLFNDPKAKAALAQIGPAIDPGQIGALKKVADQYFISSIGDQANDRLGDALFESGEFASAAACWASILTDYPDSSISTLRLLTKRAIALSRAGDAPAFADVLASVRDRYAGQTVHLAGKDVIAADYLSSLTLKPSASPTTESSGTENLASAIQLPTDPKPAWQFPLMDEATRREIEQTLNNMGWGMMASNTLGGVSPVDLDAKRLYVNWMSICFALDLHTGKMIWRSGKLADQGQRIQMMVQQGQDLSGDSVAIAPTSLTGDATLGDRVLFVRRDPTQNNFNQPRGLICLSADTGKMIWSSDNQIVLKNWNFGGTPLVVENTVFIVAHAQQQLDANLLAISIKDGTMLWTLPLGTNTQTTNFRGMTVSPDSVLAMRGSKLYVLTNNGAVLAVDLPSHALDWAFTYAPTPPAYDPRFGFNPSMMASIVHSAGAMKIVGSTLLLKEADNPTMYAIDLTGPSLAWKRPVDGSEMIAHADEQGVLLLGEDLSYMDLASRQLQWSAHLPGLGSSVRPVISEGHVELFLPRGIFEMDSDDGDTRQIFRGYDHDAGGGTLWRAGDRLVAVSSHTITAYPIR
jgi:hypothetical protein